MKRKRLPIPDLLHIDEPAKIWLIQEARKNYWRVASTYAFEDLVQDGYWQYYRIATKYRSTVKSRAHLMSLFKTTFINHIHTIVTKQNRHPFPMTFSDLALDGQEEDFIDILHNKAMYEEDGYASFMRLISEAPPAIAQLLLVLQTESGVRIMREPYLKEDGTRETTNERFCRILGLDPKLFNLAQMTKAYLQSFKSSNAESGLVEI